MKLDSIKLSQELIKYNSISSEANLSIVEFVAKILAGFGFKNDILGFDGDSSYPVINLHSIYNPNNSQNIFYFAGHLDIVPAGDENLWKYPPFEARIVNDVLYGRGAADMKPAIAAFIMAAGNFIAQNPKANSAKDFGIALLLTGDEEADGINGTKKMLEWMQKNHQPISACIVGEPTNPNQLGEMIKIGRRGSISFELKIIGKQGHIAYPENFNNPNTSIINVLKLLKDHELDNGNQFFDPSNLEITNIQTKNISGNVVPKEVIANFNIRFNNEHSSQSLIDWVKYICDKSAGQSGSEYQLSYKISGESFITKPGFLSDIASDAIKKITGLKPILSTTGGTSDARFIKDFCPVVECGLINKTAHQIDENIAIADIINLEKIYYSILENYAKR